MRAKRSSMLIWKLWRHTKVVRMVEQAAAIAVRNVMRCRSVEVGHQSADGVVAPAGHQSTSMGTTDEVGDVEVMGEITMAILRTRR